ncbi:hypothetical protein Ahy_A03g014433 isoform B [Arachis hypogaea]|uniref:Uncharacterized protein n=1 Tax=Arachis hypogaea TaxID=3818 RepID=A0A445DXX5_ARAHY|nr:hypothetical protein Ahy_A03g014433 isoform B [Arachis hypogaea]
MHWRTLNQRSPSRLALHRRRLTQVLSAAAAFSSPCRFHLRWYIVFIFLFPRWLGTSFSSSLSSRHGTQDFLEYPHLKRFDDGPIFRTL